MELMRLAKNDILKKCPYKTQKEKVDWLINYWIKLNDNEDCIVYGPKQITEIFQWLGLLKHHGVFIIK